MNNFNHIKKWFTRRIRPKRIEGRGFFPSLNFAIVAKNFFLNFKKYLNVEINLIYFSNNVFATKKVMAKSSAGFSLIELIVAFGLFSVVMFIASGSLLTLVDLNKKAQAQQSAINNVNFALENMSRSIRTGSDYRCNNNITPETWNGIDWTSVTSQDCSGGGKQIIFESENGGGCSPDQWSYWLEGTSLKVKKTTNSNFNNKTCNTGDVTISAKITAPEIVIEDMKFYVTGAENAGGAQPLVRIIIKGYAFVNDVTGTNPRRVDFNLQTLASQRKLDI